MENIKTIKNVISDGPGEKKADLIEAFAKLLDKHCADRDDVWSIIRSFREASEFMRDQRFIHGTDLMGECLYFNEVLGQKGLSIRHGELLHTLAKTANTACAISGQNTEGFNISAKMEKDLDEILAL